ncbi:MAG: hypothetical protein KAS32_13975 [Candidatus Peribacteraceae bacterium]|nr:hypothetical protein [Candidatus Peribacteraceae bacterium]
MQKTRIKNGVKQHLLNFGSGSIQILNDDDKERLSLSFEVLKDNSDKGLLRLPRSTMIVGDGIYNGYWHPDEELKKTFKMFDSQPFNTNHGDDLNSEVGWLERPQRDGLKYSAVPILNLNTPEGENALAHIQNRMYAGKPAELSVGFWCTVTREQVKHGDIDQVMPVCRDIEPDHCAVVTRGACSPSDGAGVGLKQNNKNKNKNEGNNMENKEDENEKVTDAQDGATQEVKNSEGKPEKKEADEKTKTDNSEGQDEPEPITFKDKDEFNAAVKESFASYFKQKEEDKEEDKENELKNRMDDLAKENKDLAEKFKIIKDSTDKPTRKTLSKAEYLALETPKQMNSMKKAGVLYMNHVKNCMLTNQKPYGMTYREKWNDVLGCYTGEIAKIASNLGNIFQTYDTAGADIDTWDTDMLPPEMWAGSIFEDAVTKQKLLKYILRRYDSPRKVTVPVKQWQDATWTSTRGRDTRANTDEQAYSAQGIALDPVRYRFMARIDRDSLEEATWSVEQDVRERIRIATDLKFNALIYTTLDGTALSSGNYQTAGESLTNTYTASAVDFATALTVDNLIDAAWNVRTISKQMFVPQRCILSGGMMSGLLKDSPLLSASERGNATVINTGALENALGMSFEVMGDMPQDSGSTDVGLVFDERFFWIGNVPHEFEVRPNFNEATDQMEWFTYMKSAFSIGDKEAGAVLYA